MSTGAFWLLLLLLLASFLRFVFQSVAPCQKSWKPSRPPTIFSGKSAI
jgi:hypothetical protein